MIVNPRERRALHASVSQYHNPQVTGQVVEGFVSAGRSVSGLSSVWSDLERIMSSDLSSVDYHVGLVGDLGVVQKGCMKAVFPRLLLSTRLTCEEESSDGVLDGYVPGRELSVMGFGSDASFYHKASNVLGVCSSESESGYPPCLVINYKSSDVDVSDIASNSDLLVTGIVSGGFLVPYDASQVLGLDESSDSLRRIKQSALLQRGLS